MCYDAMFNGITVPLWSLWMFNKKWKTSDIRICDIESCDEQFSSCHVGSKRCCFCTLFTLHSSNNSAVTPGYEEHFRTEFIRQDTEKFNLSHWIPIANLKAIKIQRFFLDLNLLVFQVGFKISTSKWSIVVIWAGWQFPVNNMTSSWLCHLSDHLSTSQVCPCPSGACCFMLIISDTLGAGNPQAVHLIACLILFTFSSDHVISQVVHCVHEDHLHQSQWLHPPAEIWRI